MRLAKLGLRWAVVGLLLTVACGGDDEGEAGGSGDSSSAAATSASTSGASTSGTTAGTGGGTGTSASTTDAATGGVTTSAPPGCDAPPPADPVPPRACENPTPGYQVSMDQPSGWIVCENGGGHRETAVACVNPTECATDGDCAEGQICECGGNASMCIEAHCTTDADCQEGYHCWRNVADVACDSPFDRCRVEPCVQDGTVCELCEYDPTVCAMTCIDYGPCTA